jgi:hypothetical protein
MKTSEARPVIQSDSVETKASEISSPENQFRYSIHRELNKKTNKFEEDFIIITGYKGNSKTVIIPTLIKGLPIVEIDREAFANLGLIEVTLPENIKQISFDAFSGNDIRLLPKTTATHYSIITV